MIKRMGYWLLAICYSLAFFLLAVYSYSQIDLNLTLFSNSIYQRFQQAMIHLGYFDRPLSTAIFLLVIFILYTLYFILLLLVKREKITEKQIWLLVGLSVAVLIFSYPAFSHDIFNYMFDAKIVTYYHLSPYEYKALDFPDDSWTRFMHWTHRYYPYGPLWIVLTIPISLLGLGKFTLTLLSFKIMFAIFHLGNIYLIKKILEKFEKPRLIKSKLLSAVTFYALNPLILVESLVSPHNEILMLFFLLLAIYLAFNNRGYLLSFLSLIASTGIKFLTAITLPVFIFVWQKKRWRSEVGWTKVILVMIFLITLAIGYLIWQRESYSWYLVPLLGITSLYPQSRISLFLSTGLSSGFLLRYAPFIYLGDYKQPVPAYQFWLTILPIILAVLLIILEGVARKRASC